MDIHTMLTVRDMYNNEDVDFSKWLEVTIQELEVHEDARYQEQRPKEVTHEQR